MKQWLQLCLLSLTILFSGVTSAATIDVNKADAKTLQTLEGIGPKKAQAIINYRRKNGQFKSLSDLQKVPGIGEKTLLKNKRKLSLKGGLSKVSSTKQSSSKSSSKNTRSKTSTSKSSSQSTSKKTGKSTSKKIGQKANKKTSKKSGKKLSKKSTKKTTKKPAKKSAKKTAKKTSKKTNKK